MALGLESNIAETAKAFQGNPQALQQRYTQKQDLFDLLALNMIKKQQAAAKNQLLMSQQEMPGTIIEQMENAVTKNESGEANTQTETATGVAGALATKNAQTQSNMNKMAGVASNSAANMKTLAGGGIVGFAGPEGSEVKEAKEDGMYSYSRFGKTINFKKIGNDYFRVKEDGTVAKEKAGGITLANLQADDSPLVKKLGDDVAAPFTAIPGAGDMEPRDQGSLTGAAAKPFTPIPGAGDMMPRDQELAKPFTPIPGAGNMMPRDQNDLLGIAAAKPEIKKDKDGGAPAVGGFDASKYAADDGFNTQVKGGIKDLLDSDPQKAVDFAARTPAEKAMIEKLFKERTDMRDNRMNPDKLSSDRLSQMLLGAKGATAGEAFRTAGLAGINADKNVENIRRSEFDAINKLFMTEADRSQGIKQKAFEGSQADKKQGVASGSSLTANEQSNALNAEKLFATMANNKVANKLKSELNAISAKRVTAQENNTLARVDTALLRDLTNTEKSGTNQYLKEYEAKINALPMSGKSKEEKTKLQKQYKDEYDLNITTLRNGIAAERDAIKNRLTAKTGGIKSSKFKLGQSNFKSN